MRTEARALAVAVSLAAASLAGCSGSSGSAGSTACVPNCNAPANFLAEDDVRRVIAQAVGEA